MIETGNRPKPAAYYDRLFKESDRYKQHFAVCQYWPVWLTILDRLQREGVPSFPFGGSVMWAPCGGLLDLGCGPGQFAEASASMGVENYHGLDFAGVAVLATDRRPWPDAYTFARIELEAPTGLDTGPPANWAILALETLEHVENDLQLLEALPDGHRFIATVPSFNATGHVRYFESAEDVLTRYAWRFYDDMGHGLAPRCLAIPYGDKGRRLFLLDGVTQPIS